MTTDRDELAKENARLREELEASNRAVFANAPTALEAAAKIADVHASAVDEGEYWIAGRIAAAIRAYAASLPTPEGDERSACAKCGIIFTAGEPYLLVNVSPHAASGGVMLAYHGACAPIAGRAELTRAAPTPSTAEALARALEDARENVEFYDPKAIVLGRIDAALAAHRASAAGQDKP